MLATYLVWMAAKRRITVRLDPEDAAALARARRDGHTTADLVRRGLRVVAARYYTKRRPPSTRLFVSTDAKLGDEALRWLVVALVVGSASALASPSRADIIGAVPTCPRGTDARVCHWPACVPNECTSDGDCDLGEGCAPLDLCVWDRDCGGGWGRSPARDANAECAAGCDSDHDCRTLRVCLPLPPGVDAGRRDAGLDSGSVLDGGLVREHHRYGCGCRAWTRNRGGFGGAGLLLLVALLARSRSF